MSGNHWQNSLLTSEECDWVLSLNESDLDDWLSQWEEPTLGEILSCLQNHQLPKERAECSLYAFVQQAWQVLRPGEPFIPGRHIEAVASHLEWATDTPGYNLVINIPPGFMKSLLTAVIWPAWVWGPRKWPEAQFLFASYSEKLASRDSGECRDLISSDWYQDLWPDVEIRDDSDRQMEFHLTRGGYRLATGTGGRGTGEHPHFVVGDDVNKADHSDVQFAGAVQWWSRTMSTRGRVRGSRRILQGQRLRVNDVPNWAINAAYDWLCLPMWKWDPPVKSEAGGLPDQVKAREPGPTAIGWEDWREPGDLLWPEGISEADARTMELELGPIDSAAQLQQKPIRIAAGGLFPRSKAKFIELADIPLRQIDKWARYFDKAGGESQASDRSAGILMGRWRRPSMDVKYVIFHLVLGRWNPFERDEIIAQTAAADRRQFGPSVELWIEKEPGGAGKQSALISARDLVQFGVRFDPPTTNKVVRAKPFSSAWHADNVLIVVGPWNVALLDELEMFSGEEVDGIHDDIVDACSGAANQLLIAPRRSGGLPIGIVANV